VLIQEQDKEHREMSQSLQDAVPRLEAAKQMSEALTPLIGKKSRRSGGWVVVLQIPHLVQLLHLCWPYSGHKSNV